MTTITIPRVLLEQALEKLLECWPKSDPCINGIRAEMARPPTAPAWHDVPTEPGWWVRNRAGVIVGTYWITDSVIPFLNGSGSRWYGPIQHDEKAEGGAE